jgi:[ribosomal protein S5]-alanine N-acetyltransferase
MNTDDRTMMTMNQERQRTFDFTHFPILQTERLDLRQIQPADVNALLKLFGNAEVVRFLEMQPIKSIEQANEWLKWMGGSFAAKDGLRWGITLKDGTFVGSAGLHHWNKEAHQAEISCDVAYPHWGHGYGNEAMQRILQFGWDSMNLNRIEAIVVKGNSRSVHTMEKLGFKQEGVLRQRLLKGGKFYDVHLFSLLRCDVLDNC